MTILRLLSAAEVFPALQSVSIMDKERSLGNPRSTRFDFANTYCQLPQYLRLECCRMAAIQISLVERARCDEGISVNHGNYRPLDSALYARCSHGYGVDLKQFRPSSMKRSKWEDERCLTWFRYCGCEFVGLLGYRYRMVAVERDGIEGEKR